MLNLALAGCSSRTLATRLVRFTSIAAQTEAPSLMRHLELEERSEDRTLPDCANNRSPRWWILFFADMERGRQRILPNSPV